MPFLGDGEIVGIKGVVNPKVDEYARTIFPSDGEFVSVSSKVPAAAPVEVFA